MDKNSPFDAVWSVVALATMSFSIGTFIFLRTGSLTLTPTTNAQSPIDAKVSMAFWGAGLCCLGLLILGVIAFRYAGTHYARENQPWPRLAKVESEVRDPFIAKLGLAATLGLPLIAVYSSLYTYVTRSRIALWNSDSALAPGFIGSRLLALEKGCDENPCFRMHPKIGDMALGHEWFWFSDALLVLVMLACIFVWTAYFLRVKNRHEAS